MEDGGNRDRWPSHCHPDEETTLQRLLNDRGTTVDWVNLIHSQIPIAIANIGSMGLVDGNPNLVGPRPRVFSSHQLNGNSEDLLKRPSTTMFVNMRDWPKLLQDLEEVRRLPWHNLVISAYAPGSAETVMNSFMQNFGRKLADLHRLEVHPFHHDSVLDTGAPPWAPREGEDFDGRQFLAPKLRIARVPPRLLPGLRPILYNVAVLETGISVDPESRHARTIIAVFLERLEPYSGTLISLTLTNSERQSNRQSRAPIRQDPSSNPEPRERRVSFPLLKRLQLISFAECTVQNVLSVMDCPSVSHFSLSTRMYTPMDDRRNVCISAALLHNSFPVLRRIAMDFWDSSVRPCNSGVKLPLSYDYDSSAKRRIPYRLRGPGWEWELVLFKH